jgi:uncharacterized protein
MNSMSVARSGWLAFLAGAALALDLTASVHASTPIPPFPKNEVYVHDYADLLPSGDEAEVQKLCKEALERYNSPIVVVTITRFGDYGSSSVEGLATHWFNEWRIGTLGLQKGTNQGILLLVAVVDRKARIELGATWGRSRDQRSQRIMSNEIVPQFKAGDYSSGIRQGVEALLDMARYGPDSHPPGDFLDSMVRPYCQYTFFDPKIFLGFMALGSLLILAGIYTPNHRGWLISAGIVLVLVGAFSYVLFTLILILGAGSGGARTGGGSSGRGYSGGYSGGGGATGSW